MTENKNVKTFFWPQENNKALEKEIRWNLGWFHHQEVTFGCP